MTRRRSGTKNEGTLSERLGKPLAKKPLQSSWMCSSCEAKARAAATTHVCPGSRLLFGKLLRKVGESLRQFGIMSQSAGTRPRKLRQLSQQHAKAQDVVFRRGSSRKISRTLC